MNKPLPAPLLATCRQRGIAGTPCLLLVSIPDQRMILLKKNARTPAGHIFPSYRRTKNFVISTSRFGPGQVQGSNQTPLGLHRVAEKIGAGWPQGTVFKSRLPVGCTWQGMPEASIVHRILWLEGLEPGHNRGGRVDTFARYVYIHGYGNELTLGKPQSCGCIHVAAHDLLPLFDELPTGTLVWITPEPFA